jgi:hypothetical protein
MKPLFIVMALAGVLMTVSGASAHFSRPSPSVSPAHDVYVNGQYVGSDPDQRIRSGLARDNSQNLGGS